MAKIKNNPHELLEDEHISKSMLSEKAIQALALFDKAKLLFEKHPTSKDFLENAEKVGKIANDLIIKELTRIKSESKNEIEEDEKKHLKKTQSKKIMEKSEKVLDDLDICRERLKEDRKRKIESGEIEPPKKKTLTTKLRGDLLRFAILIPKNLRDNADVIAKTEKAILRFLNELKSIWGINKVKPITDEIRERFRKLEEAAVKPKNFRLN